MDSEKRDRHHNEDEAPNADIISRSMKAEQREKHRENTRNMNKLWLWFGVLILVAILLWWIMSIGLAEDATGISNGTSIEAVEPVVEAEQQANQIESQEAAAPQNENAEAQPAAQQADQNAEQPAAEQPATQPAAN